MGDRSGGREAKGSSLKKSKKNPGCAVAKKGKTKKDENITLTSASAPFPSSNEPYFDCGTAILSRQFDRDRERVLTRAQSEGCCAIVSWFSDIEKQTELADLAKQYTGYCYFIVGIHPDNIDRTNKKSHETWLEKVEELAKRPECVAIMTGLNLNREVGTHFPQEALFRSSCALANKLLLPLHIHCASDGSSLDKALELLEEEGWTNSESNRVLLHDSITACGGDINKVKKVVDAGITLAISASGITDPDDKIKENSIGCVKLIPIRQLLACTDSPWRTPQNLTDPYLRTLRNEPCNIGSVILAISEASGVDLAELKDTLKENAIEMYGLVEQVPITTIDTNNVTVDDNTIKKKAIEKKEKVDKKDENKSQKPKKSKKQNDSDDDLDDNELAQNISTLNVTEKAEGNADDTPSQQNLNRDNAEDDSDEEEDVSFYGCLKCRHRLFNENDTNNHGIDAAKTVFKVGEEGLCKSAIFLSCIDSTDLTSRTMLSIQGTSILCRKCGLKLGKYNIGETTCPCGAIIKGPTAKVTASKLDFFDISLTKDTNLLAARALIEADELNRIAALDEQMENDKHGKSKIKKKKKLLFHGDNKGNFSNFRNKSFVKGASRVGKKETANDDNANDDEDNDNDDDDDDDDEEEEN